MNKLRIAIVGAGHLGRIHAKLLSERPDVAVVGVADPSAEAREQIASNCRLTTVADYHELIDQTDAAIVATPTRNHHEVAIDFLNRGLHVLVEKPLAASVREADAMVAAARRRHSVLQVGHVERFNPALTAVQAEIVRPRFIEGVRAGRFTARSTDIGVVLDLMIHDIDVMLSLVGARIRHVEALGRALLGRHEDLAHARFEFENGCIAQLTASRVHFGPARREMHIWSDDVMVDIDFGARMARVTKPSQAVLRHEIDVATMTADELQALASHLHEEHLCVTEPPIEQRNSIVDEHEDFIESIRQRRAPRISGDVGRDVLVVAEQVLAAIAARNDQTSPTVPPVTPHPTLRGPHWQAGKPIARSRRAG